MVSWLHHLGGVDMSDDDTEAMHPPSMSFRQARRNYVMHRDRRNQKRLRGWGVMTAVVALAGLVWWAIRL